MPSSTAAAPADERATSAPRWLTDEQMQAWLPLLRVVQLLPQALDTQLREQTGINHTWYSMLAVLSGRPDRRLPLTELARAASMSQSRASHAVTSLQDRGLVDRRSCPTDGRVQYVELTDAGQALLEQYAPGHVDEVRRLVFDQLDERDVGDLRRIASKVLAALDAPSLPFPTPHHEEHPWHGSSSSVAPATPAATSRRRPSRAVTRSSP